MLILRRYLSTRSILTPNLLTLLSERGLIHQFAGDRNVLVSALQKRKVGFYAGVDPTAPSLHLGHLLPLMVLFWAWSLGHDVVSLVGGATAKVGDPTGRLRSREKTREGVKRHDADALGRQMEGVWGRVGQYADRHGYAERGSWKLLNNETWLGELSVMRYMRMLENVRIGPMLGKETVRMKMERGDGMSYPEFSYPLLQAIDWWHLFERHGVQVQVGGGDQYGNITAGMHLVSSLVGEGDIGDRPMGLTVPLLTTASGDKFGKSAGNAVWLDAEMTSPFDLYGFLVGSSDEDVERYLKLFTFLPLHDIFAVMEKHRADPSKRRAQHVLASEVLELVHGSETALKARQEHEALHNPAKLTQQEGIFLPAQVVESTFPRLLHRAGLAASKSEASRLIASGGAYVAQQTVEPVKFVPIGSEDQPSQFVHNKTLVLRMGKWKTRVIHLH
ncbi:tyrosyl-tRNA synthetase [Piedraia hortae CBS 480.64]|uniref:Tyrosine--tRNA ligase n=1 Tax=Piedraia hortae CBS 480.64 TaxID=1314780 RepID=A0A6A7BRQ0_9PEZI|nr:tyrosyl-tRNA synthetase [Piedraia hortae CBS 480.64]